jgi:hypothetical protein
MKISRWVVVLFLAAAIILFIGIFFWPFILNNIIKPTALVVWFLLRILILSVDQEYFWTIMILVAVIFLFRLLPRKQSSPPQQVNFPETNATINRIGYWHILFTYDGRNVKEDQILRQSLIHLLTSFYASKQRIANNFGIHEALRQGDIPLPENIHTYLFPQELQETGGRSKNFFHSFRTTPRKWIYQVSGQAKAEHERMISEVLNFLETSLEIKNED